MPPQLDTPGTADHHRPPGGDLPGRGTRNGTGTSGSAGRAAGPTTAAALLSYLSQTRPGLRPMVPAAARTQAGFLRYMEALWLLRHPGARGLDKPESLVLGCRSFALSRGCRLQGQVLEIPRPAGGPALPGPVPAIRRPVPGPGLSRGLPQLLPRSPQKPGQLALGSPHRHDRGRIRPPVHHTG